MNGAAMEEISKLLVEVLNKKFIRAVVSGPRTTGDGYYESCVIGIEGNQIELTV